VRISDLITSYILQRMEQTEDGVAQLKRNELAEELGCVPSQINYVLTSRFTPEHGYVVESRRGGGGYIRIYRVQQQPTVSPLMHVVNAIGDTLTPAAARVILENLTYAGHLSRGAASLIAAALSERALKSVPPSDKATVRADLMKQMLTTLIL
jgi:transcriptional regulator CtsR